MQVVSRCAVFLDRSQYDGETTGSEMTEINIKCSSQFLHVVEASRAQPLMQ